MIQQNNLQLIIWPKQLINQLSGLTSLCVAKDRLFVGSEMGAVWLATLPDLTISLFHFEIDCIEAVAHISNYTVITTSSGKISIFQNFKILLTWTFFFFSLQCLINMLLVQIVYEFEYNNTMNISCFNYSNITEFLRNIN